MFKALYEFTLGNGFQYLNEFEDFNVYNTVGLVTLLVALGLCAIYYLAVNRMTDKYDQVLHWAIVLGVVVVFSGIFAYWQARHNLMENIGADDYSVPILFWVMNMIYALLYFVIGSVAFKKLSKYATKIPF
jgi:hypothetical protein